MKKITVRRLRRGDVLEPDGSVVTNVIICKHIPSYRDVVLVDIKEPERLRAKSFMLDAGWPLFLRETPK